MRPIFGSRVRRTLLTSVAVGFLALLPTMATLVPLAADGGAYMVCFWRAEGPDGTSLGGPGGGSPFVGLEADAVPLLGYVGCTYLEGDGEVYWVARVHAMPLAGVVACYVLALTVGVGAWLTRPRPW